MPNIKLKLKKNPIGRIARTYVSLVMFIDLRPSRSVVVLARTCVMTVANLFAVSFCWKCVYNHNFLQHVPCCKYNGYIELVLNYWSKGVPRLRNPAQLAGDQLVGSVLVLTKA